MGIISRLLDLLPSPNGAHHELPSTIVEEMDGLSFFDLLKCGTCFVPWTEHSPECSQHRNRERRLEILRRVKHLPAYQRDLHLARVNGYAD